MKFKVKRILLWAVVAGMGMPLLFQSCKHKKTVIPDPNKFTADSSAFVVDESFKPIIEEELYIFKSLYDNVHPRVIYAPENDAVHLLLSDSTRVAILARELTPDELKTLSIKNLEPAVDRFAIDAVTLIVNSQSKDTTITLSELKKRLNSNTKQDENIVFDNPNSGLVRYLKDFSGNPTLKGKNVYALKSNKEVIKYISGHPNALGITGFSWLNDPDKDYADDVQKVKIVSVMDDISKNAPKEYFSPSQNTLALKQYPLTRNLYMLNCTGKYSLGMKFAAFLASDRGQRIILKSGLLPDNIPGREISIVKKIKQ